MGAHDLPGPIGTDPSFGSVTDESLSQPTGATELPGPLGNDAIPLRDGDRIVTTVTKDWEPPNPSARPAIVVRGATLAAVETELNALSEWGRGAGAIRTDPIGVGTSPTV